ncbi:MAG: hypothetical protein IJ733_01470 [Lachnospiraceae bacterium]|nr:hypothetical protein [Lachnospiraceae bacterium]
MDRKSFFRGFGIGVIFASLILGISFVVRTSDSFTKQRALELGMIYESNGDAKTVLSENAGGDTKSAEELAASVEDKEETEEGTSENSEGTEEKETKTSEKKSEKKKKTGSSSDSKQSSSDDAAIDMKKEKEKMEKSVRSEEQKLTINAGEWSTAVSKKLQDMGIIKDAADFDKWLDKNGYSSSISAGTYQVSKNDTYLELARKITKK